MNLLATGQDLANVLSSFLSLWWKPVLIVISSAGGVIAIVAGVKYYFATQSGDENKVKVTRNALIGILISIAIVFVLAVIIPVLVGWLGDWADSQQVTEIITRVI